MNALQLPNADGFHTNFVAALSSSQVRFYAENGRFAFLAPLRGLWVSAMFLAKCCDKNNK